MNFTVKLIAKVDESILRSLELPEDLTIGSEDLIPDEALWRHGIYDEESFKEQLGHLFEIVGGD